MPNISLKKAHATLRSVYNSYKSHFKKLNKNDLGSIEGQMQDLDTAIQKKDRKEATRLTKEVRRFEKKHFPKSLGQIILEILIALVVALCVAVVVRQMWFELYQIPTGSMRPSFREKDRLIVSKTSFALNVPLMADHFYFGEKDLQRGNVVIWSTEDIALANTDDWYFGVIPYKRRYIKRLIGKPGDSLYFYGGKIWAVDKEGNDLAAIREADWTKGLEHVPFGRLEEDVGHSHKDGNESALSFKLFNQPVGRIVVDINGDKRTEIFNDNGWKKEVAPYERTASKEVTTFGDRLGIRNFGMARLLTQSELQKGGKNATNLADQGTLFLQIAHHYNLSHPAPSLKSFYDGTIRAQLTPYQTIIPLKEEHIQKIQENLYTARFVVKEGRAARYRAEGTSFSKESPLFPNVPDGTYEFYYGKGFSVSSSGKLTELPEDHPLYDSSPENIRRLYNLGIEFSNYYQPFSNIFNAYPTRYVYWRDGSLYLMGAPILEKDDPVLQAFVMSEKERQENTERYVAFEDYGPPLKDGGVDAEFIRAFGITIPEGHYVVLGDNHAMSFDSRYFGFVPEGNLEGTPSLIMWPPGRWGLPVQAQTAWVTLPRLIVWLSAILIVWGYMSWDRKRCQRPVFKKLSKG